MHEGINYFHELPLPQFKIRKSKKIKSIHSESLIEDTALYETLQETRAVLSECALKSME